MHEIGGAELLHQPDIKPVGARRRRRLAARRARRPRHPRAGRNNRRSSDGRRRRIPRRRRRRDRFRSTRSCWLHQCGMIGRTICEGCSASTWTELTASCRRRAIPSGSPVFGLTSKCGKLLDEMSSRMRWPALNRLAVGKGSTAISCDLARRHQLAVLPRCRDSAAQDAVGEVHARSLGIVGARRIHVDELDGEVGVRTRRTAIQSCASIGPVISTSAVSGARLEDQHVGAAGQRQVGLARAEEARPLDLVEAPPRISGSPDGDRAADASAPDGRDRSRSSARARRRRQGSSGERAVAMQMEWRPARSGSGQASPLVQRPP